MFFDTRHFKWWCQRRSRGFDDRELWNLDNSLATWLLPRLKAFRDTQCTAIPADKFKTLAEYHRAMDDCIFMLEKHKDSWGWGRFDLSEQDKLRYDEGHKFLCDYWVCWWS